MLVDQKRLAKTYKNLQKGNQYCQLTKNLCLLAEKKNVIMNTIAQPSPNQVKLKFDLILLNGYNTA